MSEDKSGEPRVQMHGKLLHQSHHLKPVEIQLPVIPLSFSSNVRVCSCAPPTKNCVAPSPRLQNFRKSFRRGLVMRSRSGASALACSVRRHRSCRTQLCHRCGSPLLVACASGSSKDSSIFGKLCAAFNTARRVSSSSFWALSSMSSST